MPPYTRNQLKHIMLYVILIVDVLNRIPQLIRRKFRLTAPAEPLAVTGIDTRDATRDISTSVLASANANFSRAFDVRLAAPTSCYNRAWTRLVITDSARSCMPQWYGTRTSSTLEYNTKYSQREREREREYTMSDWHRCVFMSRVIVTFLTTAR